MKCTDKEWQHCRVEKMGCPGCYYDEIEVGEWIRNKDGYIDKVKKIINPDEYMREKYYCCESTMASSHRSQIVKHSKNILDLIEVGDFVNGYRVLAIEKSGVYDNASRIMIYKNDRRKEEIWKYIQEYDGVIHTQDDIESILTHEQYEENCFEVVQE